MKRFFVILTAIVLCLALTSCAAFGDMISVLQGGGNSAASDDPTIGTWVCKKVTAYGLDLTLADVFSDVPALEIKSRGALTLTLDGESYRGKWTREDDEFTLIISGETFAATIDSGVMTFKDLLGFGLIFEKEGGVPEATGSSKPGGSGNSTAAPASSGDSFEGFWVGNTVAMLGEPASDMLFGIAKVSEYIFMELLDDGTTRIFYMGESFESTWEAADGRNGTIEFMTVPCKMSLEDGELTFTLGDESNQGMEMVFTFLPGSGTFDEKASSVPASPFDELGEYDEYGGNSELISLFEGDWYGTVHIEEGLGSLSSITGAEADAIARFSFEDGECLPFIGISITGADPYIDDLTATLEYGELVLNGTFIDSEIEETFIEYDPYSNAPATISLIGGTSERGYIATLYLRPWGEAWRSKDKHKPKDLAIERLAGITLDEAAKDYVNMDFDLIPEKSGAASGNTAGSDSSSAPATLGDMPPVSTERATLEKLSEVFYGYWGSWDLLTDKTYEQIAEEVGCGATEIEDDLATYKRTYRWRSQGNDSRFMIFVFELVDGQWKYSTFQSNNLVRP